MPYFVFKIGADGILEQRGSHDKYSTAREQVRGFRSEQAEDSTDIFKLIFARNLPEAEKLLTTPREAPVVGDD